MTFKNSKLRAPYMSLLEELPLKEENKCYHTLPDKC